ncbi:LemA family protein [Ramlibacter sp. H39-3-26]|uniref:LemA family protein n=1 Tax=Curvibacter soli TaxID=3031331 RepID=UPI0023DAA7FA|nr:LemA family protein [Ramlibacter sp. H39-3-26]MDF1485917.1 LemA family protein [Ramlibacter sp. H39-3-26]
MMSSSLVSWLVIAMLVFWAIGAYNRLMRLRSAALQAFGTLDAQLVRLMALLGECDTLAPEGEDVPRALQALVTLRAAATQFSAGLAVVRAQPLQADSVAALAAAHNALREAWGALHQVATGSAWFAAMPPRWEQHMLYAEQATLQFSGAVSAYNGAIAQFPAMVLAWLFGFRAARSL